MLVYHSSIITSSKKGGWFYINFYHCKQITSESNFTVHILHCWELTCLMRELLSCKLPKLCVCVCVCVCVCAYIYIYIYITITQQNQYIMNDNFLRSAFMLNIIYRSSKFSSQLRKL